jgi:polar amino acid transport system permease protein
VSVVAVADMTRKGREFMAANFDPFQTWIMIGLLYLVMTLLAGRLVAYLERRYKLEK